MIDTLISYSPDFIEQQHEPVLSPEMSAVVDHLNPTIPQQFKESAAIVAKYISELDEGSYPENPGRKKFVEQVIHTGFIVDIKALYQLPYLWETTPDPGVALPSWLQDDTPQQPEAKHYTHHQLYTSIDPLFNQLTTTNHWASYEAGGETYFRVQEEEVTNNPSRYKCYIEDEGLEETLQTGKLAGLLHTLSEKKLQPDRVKLSEGTRLVLYFDRSINDFGGIEKLFALYGVPSRGPVQDVYELNVQRDGSIKLRAAYSNDGALGEGGHTPITYTVAQYSPGAFLENYLRLCLYAGKDPKEPYRTSFVYLVDQEGKIKKGKEAIIAKEAAQIRYPVVYAHNRLDLPLLIDEKPRKTDLFQNLRTKIFS